MRPLAAALCFGEGDFVLDGVERMRERPIADLVDGLTQLGAEVSCSDTGCPPVTISAKVIRVPKFRHLSESKRNFSEISGKSNSSHLMSLFDSR